MIDKATKDAYLKSRATNTREDAARENGISPASGFNIEAEVKATLNETRSFDEAMRDYPTAAKTFQSLIDLGGVGKKLDIPIQRAPLGLSVVKVMEAEDLDVERTSERLKTVIKSEKKGVTEKVFAFASSMLDGGIEDMAQLKGLENDFEDLSENLRRVSEDLDGKISEEKALDERIIEIGEQIELKEKEFESKSKRIERYEEVKRSLAHNGQTFEDTETLCKTLETVRQLGGNTKALTEKLKVSDNLDDYIAKRRAEAKEADDEAIERAKDLSLIKTDLLKEEGKLSMLQVKVTTHSTELEEIERSRKMTADELGILLNVKPIVEQIIPKVKNLTDEYEDLRAKVEQLGAAKESIEDVLQKYHGHTVKCVELDSLYEVKKKDLNARFESRKAEIDEQLGKMDGDLQLALGFRMILIDPTAVNPQMLARIKEVAEAAMGDLESGVYSFADSKRKELSNLIISVLKKTVEPDLVSKIDYILLEHKVKELASKLSRSDEKMSSKDEQLLSKVEEIIYLKNEYAKLETKVQQLSIEPPKKPVVLLDPLRVRGKLSLVKPDDEKSKF